MVRAVIWILNGAIISGVSGYGLGSWRFWVLGLWVTVVSEVVSRYPRASATGSFTDKGITQ